MKGGDSIAVLPPGLPNIEGTVLFFGQNWSGGYPVWTSPSGAFYNAGGSYSIGRINNDSTQAMPNLGFEAARSNSIYGTSATVQPPTINAIIQVRF